MSHEKPEQPLGPSAGHRRQPAGGQALGLRQLPPPPAIPARSATGQPHVWPARRVPPPASAGRLPTRKVPADESAQSAADLAAAAGHQAFAFQRRRSA